MLTKKPISPSSSRRVRLATGEPTTTIRPARRGGRGGPGPGGEENHEGSGRALAGEGGEGLRESSGGRATARRPPRFLGTAGRGRSVGSSRTGDAGEPLPPVGELLREHSPFEVLPLPEGEVGVLERQLGEAPGGRRAARREGPVEGRELVDEDPHRPAVGDDVVLGEEDPVLGRGEPEEGRAQERAGREVERPPRLLPGEALCLGGARGARQGLEVDRGKPGVEGRQGLLERLAVDEDEAGAQGLVPADDLGKGPAEGRQVEPPGECHVGGDVVERAPGLQTVQEPEPLLGVGEEGAGTARPGAGTPAAAGWLPPPWPATRPRPPGRAPRAWGPRRGCARGARGRRPRSPGRSPGWRGASGRRGRRSCPRPRCSRRPSAPSTSLQIPAEPALDRRPRRDRRAPGGAPAIPAGDRLLQGPADRPCRGR